MAKSKLGGLRPRYGFMLNPYVDIRLSKCPRCDQLTHPRKFALLIDGEGWGPLVLGKTCRFCTPCQLIIAHKDELEAELANSFTTLAPERIGQPYLGLGTVDKKFWQKGLKSKDTMFADMLKHFAEFKKVYDLKVTGGWQPGPGHKPKK